MECVQALHRVSGAAQLPEVAVPTGGHVQLPAKESHREQGELMLRMAGELIIPAECVVWGDEKNYRSLTPKKFRIASRLYIVKN